MSNKSSSEIKDTRGRPRVGEMSEYSRSIAEAFGKDSLPLNIPADSPRDLAKRLRFSAAFKEMQKGLGVKLRLLPREDKLTICLRKV